MEKVITAYVRPEGVEGDPYVRIPITEDKDPSTTRVDRETGFYITLWEEKIRYPYKTKVPYEINIITTKHSYKVDILLTDGEYFWNGSNIHKFLWTLLGISQDSPEGLVASLAHDNLLQYKQHFIDLMRKYNPNLTVNEFRLLTTQVYEKLLENYGVRPIKTKIMGLFINIWQKYFTPDWNYIL